MQWWWCYLGLWFECARSVFGIDAVRSVREWWLCWAWLLTSLVGQAYVGCPRGDWLVQHCFSFWVFMLIIDAAQNDHLSMEWIQTHPHCYFACLFYAADFPFLLGLGFWCSFTSSATGASNACYDCCSVYLFILCYSYWDVYTPFQRSLYLLSLSANRFDQDLFEAYVNEFVHSSDWSPVWLESSQSRVLLSLHSRLPYVFMPAWNGSASLAFTWSVNMHAASAHGLAFIIKEVFSFACALLTRQLPLYTCAQIFLHFASSSDRRHFVSRLDRNLFMARKPPKACGVGINCMLFITNR